jgi:hypothetical protein
VWCWAIPQIDTAARAGHEEEQGQQLWWLMGYARGMKPQPVRVLLSGGSGQALAVCPQPPIPVANPEIHPTAHYFQFKSPTDLDQHCSLPYGSPAPPSGSTVDSW